MIVIVAGKTVKGPVTVDIANSEGAEPLSSDSASATKRSTPD